MFNNSCICITIIFFNYFFTKISISNKFEESQLIISSYLSKKDIFFSFENFDLKNLFFDKSFSNN